MDVFYFNSPPVLVHEGLKWSSKPSAKRRRVCSTMDFPPYRAHVARIAEPAVYANDLTSLPTQYLDVFLDAGLYAPSRSLPSPLLEGQGVGHSVAAKIESTSDHEPPSEDQVPPPAMHMSPGQSSALPPRHPRPESIDLWEEEDSRRIRFALPDDSDDHVERLRNSYASRHGIPPPEPPPRPPATSQPLQPWESHPPSVSDTSLTLPPLADLVPSLFPMPPPPPDAIPFTASQLLWDDSVLAVDDHQRSYDFADWMEQWRVRARYEYGIPAFRSQASPSTWRRPLHKYVRRKHVTDTVLDSQGLDWECFGVERSCALKARRLLHPHSPATDFKRDQDDREDEGPHYRFQSFSPRHHARYSHYQLRNMTAARDRSRIYYAAGSKLMKASSSCPDEKETVVDLSQPSRSATPFKVTCVATSVTASRSQGGDDVLLAGGFNGEYAMLDLKSSTKSKPIEGTVSHARDGIVNHISTYHDRPSGSLCAAFCSNDHTLRLMDIRRQQFTNTFTFDSAINCSATSPDGRLRALVHDGLDSWITNAETGEILVKLKAHTDFAFACDWSLCGRYVATGSEDQQTIIWDARNWSKPTQKLEAVISCPRSLHFTDDGKLLVAENEDIASIVDTANFATRQDVRFFGSIAGICLVNGGEEVVVANADQTAGGLMSLRRISRGRGGGYFGQKVGSGRGREYEESVVDGIVV